MPVQHSITRRKSLDRGRNCYASRRGESAFSQLAAADRETPLEPMDLVELGQAAFLIGKDLEGGESLPARIRDFSAKAKYNRPPAAHFGWDSPC